MQDRKPRRRGDMSEGTHPLLGAAPTLALMRANMTPAEVAAAAANDVEEATPWWNPFARPKVIATTLPQRLEPKTFLASERTFMSWMHMAITLASIAAALLAFAATSHKTKDRMHQLSRNLVEFIALLLLPLAVFIVAYALMVFLWRNSQIAMKQASYIDDRRGPLVLATLVVSALGAIFIVSAVDLYDQIAESGDAPMPPAPEPSPLLLGLASHITSA